MVGMTDEEVFMSAVYFTRHGQTFWNVEDKICGVTDIALTPQGHAQAVALGEMIRDGGYPIDEILCSPLVRAADTARHIAELTGLPLRVEPRLREQCFGRFEATSPRRSAEFTAAKTQFTNRYGDGESMLRLAQRIYNLLDELRAQDKTCLLVAHNGIARVVHSYFNEMTNEEYAAFGIGNCQLLRYSFDEAPKLIF